jgi:hypothetical protein
VDGAVQIDVVGAVASAGAADLGALDGPALVRLVGRVEDLDAVGGLEALQRAVDLGHAEQAAEAAGGLRAEAPGRRRAAIEPVTSTNGRAAGLALVVRPAGHERAVTLLGEEAAGREGGQRQEAQNE